MQFVKCRFCQKRLPKDTAVLVKSGKANTYYCPEHVGLQTPKQSFTSRVKEITRDNIVWSVFNKEVSPLVSEHGIDKINSYLEHNNQYLSNKMDSLNSSNFARTRYFLAVLKNSLPQYKYKPPVVVNKDIEDPVEGKERYKKKKRPSLNDLLNQDG